MKPTLHTIAFKFIINKLRNYLPDDADIYDLSSDYRYKNLRYVSTCGRALHYVGGTLNNDCMGYYFTYNAKITLHDIAD